MTTNQARKILTDFYEEFYDIAEDGDYPNNTDRIKAEEEVLQDYAMKIIDKGE